MIEFESVVYLDHQKTGSTSIVEFLRTILREEETGHGIHSAPAQGHDTAKFHFTSIRHPLSLYISLFNYGVSGRGGLLRSLERRGHGELYDPSVHGFCRWLEFMLDPTNAPVIRKKFAGANISALCGPLSQRLLMLSFVEPVAALAAQAFTTRADLLRYFRAERLYDYYVRTEQLAPDLFEVWKVLRERSRLRRRFRKLTSAEELDAIIPRKNVGEKIEALTREAIPAELRGRVRDQEWLMYDAFGYDEGKGNPPPLPPRGAEPTAEPA